MTFTFQPRNVRPPPPSPPLPTNGLTLRQQILNAIVYRLNQLRLGAHDMDGRILRRLQGLGGTVEEQAASIDAVFQADSDLVCPFVDMIRRTIRIGESANGAMLNMISDMVDRANHLR